MRILIGALSCWQYNERRARCEQTWMRQGDKFAESHHPTPDRNDPRNHTITRSVFLIGIPELPLPELIERYMLLPGPNDYPSLPQRTRSFCKFALTFDNWDYIFKCDDDTYISMPRLVSYPLHDDYIGAEWQEGVGYGSGGGGYFLSRKAAEIISIHMVQETGAEDVLVRDTLSQHGIQFTKDQRFVAFGNEQRRPRRDNDLITLHGVEADLFYKSHEEVG